MPKTDNRGKYDRWPKEAIEARDAELKGCGQMPGNQARRAAAWRNAVKNNLVSSAVIEKINAMIKAAGGTPAPKAPKKPVVKKVPKKPALKMAPKPKATSRTPKDPTQGGRHGKFPERAKAPARMVPMVGGKVEVNYAEVARLEHNLTNAQHLLSDVCDARGQLGVFATEEQNERFCGIIDRCVDAFEAAYEAAHPSFIASEPQITEPPAEEPEDEPVAIVPPPTPITTTAIPTPPPPPAMQTGMPPTPPPVIPKPPTL